ncbi:hypothetical protein EIZ47_08965 [Chryseobacterium lacus]|uniref:Uncharacterized protein n=1 Tax=Chryseobacterium lacus TaxID=2058346 RepID=A0A368MX21_9FLAO|nr:hypothetical protein [Chryseobacterium lacus]RCU42470.1 hypothetical protein DQ356_09055 [Chryseobacterium lacus]RST27032.1 hypothetical protein EIZ47_08965 [Chryseobacterium lacus]
MNMMLRRLKNIISENAITIILNTHRTLPDNQKDSLLLKNLIKEAETRLLADMDKREAESLIQRLRDLEETIDHRQNLESLILFVNEDTAEYVRLPIAVEDRVIIDKTFATRDLIRAMHMEASYLVLVLSQQKARLIKASNDKVIQEFGDPFPIENNQMVNRAELSNASRLTNLISEFYNQVDKEVNHFRKENKLPVLICSETSQYHEYLKVADEKNSIYDQCLSGNHDTAKAHHIVTEAWEIVKKYVIEKNNARKAELQKAISSGKFLSDTNEIWQGIQQGSVQTIFIEEGNFQPAKWIDGHITYVSPEMRNGKSVVDDIYDELIEANLRQGGDTVFLPKGELKDFNGFGAVTRY